MLSVEAVDQVGRAQKACGFVQGILLAKERWLAHLCSIELLASLVRVVVSTMYRVRITTTGGSHLHVLFVVVVEATLLLTM